MTSPAPLPDPEPDLLDALDFDDDDPDDALTFFADLNDGEDWGWEP